MVLLFCKLRAGCNIYGSGTVISSISVLLGLRYDDCLHEYPDVKEALRRLPKDLQYERQFRISRALQLNLQKTTLPREEWTKYEEVAYHSFLIHSALSVALSWVHRSLNIIDYVVLHD